MMPNEKTKTPFSTVTHQADLCVEGVMPDGAVRVLAEETNNYQRLRRYAVEGEFTEVRLTPLETWGDERCRLFAFEIE